MASTRGFSLSAHVSCEDSRAMRRLEQALEPQEELPANQKPRYRACSEPTLYVVSRCGSVLFLINRLNEDTPPFLLSCYRVPGNLTLSRWAALVPQPVHSEKTIGTHLKMLGLAT